MFPVILALCFVFKIEQVRVTCFFKRLSMRQKIPKKSPFNLNPKICILVLKKLNCILGVKNRRSLMITTITVYVISGI